VTSSADRPLAGRSVVVTRAAEQASRLVATLAHRGATVVEVPTIVIMDAPDGGAALTDAVAHLDRYDWVVLTSTNGVQRFLAAGGSAAAAGVRIAVVGPGTADALRHGGREPDLVPERFVAEALLEVFPPGPGRVLLPQASAARPVLADGLGAAGWDVDAVVAYRTVAARPGPAVLERAAAADAITFTSGSTVTGYLAAAGPDAVPPVVVCIGPVTAGAAEQAGLTVTAVAAEHTIDGLAAAVVAALTAPPPFPPK
jgi:uroporphyrinogen-III synthase